MPTFQVTPDELAAGGAVVVRGEADLTAACGRVAGTGQAAAGTPAAGAYEALLSDLSRTARTVGTSVQSLSSALNQAAQNYTRTEQSTTACYAPGFGG